MELTRKSNNAFDLQINQGQQWHTVKKWTGRKNIVNLKCHVDRYRGIDVAHTLIVNKLNQDINYDNFLSQMTVLQPGF